MNTETNRFEHLDIGQLIDTKKYIEFRVGTGYEINGYNFRLEKVDVENNRLILSPIGVYVKPK